MEWILCVALLGSPSKVPQSNDAGITVDYANETQYFAWSHREQIVNMEAEGLTPWVSFWTQQGGSGTWTLSLLEPKKDIVLSVTTCDLLKIRKVYRLDKYGNQLPME